MLKFNVFGNTDTGKSRTNNEDAFVIQTVWNDRHLLAVVIDGVGGYEGGELAAKIAQETIVEYLQEYPNGERLSLLKQAITRANNAIFEQKEISKDHEQMCCVLTASLFDLDKGQLHLVHVGDTRLYCCENNVLIKLSHDHSDVGYREEIGELTEKEAMNHPQRNIINRVVGVKLHNIDDLGFIDSQTLSIVPGATYMLCSDGLCDMLTSTEMVSVLKRRVLLKRKVQSLIDFANVKGGKDNITVVLVEIEGEIPKVQENEIIDNIQSVDENEAIIPSNSEDNKKNLWKNPFLIIGLCFVLGFLSGWFGCMIYKTKYQSKSVSSTDSIQTQPIDVFLPIGDNDTLGIDTLRIFENNDTILTDTFTIN